MYIDKRSQRSPTSGLDVVEIHGLDYSTALLVVEEKVPKSDVSLSYGFSK